MDGEPGDRRIRIADDVAPRRRYMELRAFVNLPLGRNRGVPLLSPAVRRTRTSHCARRLIGRQRDKSRSVLQSWYVSVRPDQTRIDPVWSGNSKL